jgi:CHAD domain-containing protein
MSEFVRRQTAALLKKLAGEIENAASDADADAIHDLRVAIRRLSRCLRTFAQFYPGRSWKKARRDLSELLHAAGAVRDRDIAMELLAGAGVGPRSAVISRLKKERVKAQQKLVSDLQQWRDGKRAERWLRRLEVEP